MSFQLMVVVPHRALFQRQSHVRPPLSAYKVRKRNVGLRTTLDLILGFHSLLENRACILPGHLTDRSERLGALHPFHRSVWSKHVLSPANNPYFSAFATSRQTS